MGVVHSVVVIQLAINSRAKQVTYARMHPAYIRGIHDFISCSQCSVRRSRMQPYAKRFMQCYFNQGGANDNAVPRIVCSYAARSRNFYAGVLLWEPFHPVDET